MTLFQAGADFVWLLMDDNFLLHWPPICAHSETSMLQRDHTWRWKAEVEVDGVSVSHWSLSSLSFCWLVGCLLVSLHAPQAYQTARHRLNRRHIHCTISGCFWRKLTTISGGSLHKMCEYLIPDITISSRSSSLYERLFHQKCHSNQDYPDDTVTIIFSDLTKFLQCKQWQINRSLTLLLEKNTIISSYLFKRRWPADIHGCILYLLSTVRWCRTVRVQEWLLWLK